MNSFFTWLNNFKNAISAVVFIIGLFVSGVNYLNKRIIDPIDQLINKVDSLTLRVSFLEPKDKDVLIYDIHRSFIEQSCYVGEDCVAVVTARRTQFGAACFNPVVTLQVLNYGGFTHSAELLQKLGNIVSTDDWTRVELSFRVPSGVRQGRALLKLFLVYDCPTGRITSEAPPLPFIVTKRKGDN